MQRPASPGSARDIGKSLGARQSGVKGPISPLCGKSDQASPRAMREWGPNGGRSHFRFGGSERWVATGALTYRGACAGNPLSIYECLNNRISQIVLSVCLKFPIPRKATLRMFKESVWAIAQHYELWPTPLIDITPNLRAAASFALWNGRSKGNLYIVAIPPSTNSITFEADEHVVLARLQAVCPPIAKRPHYQDGFLVGRFPFDGPNPNQIDTEPNKFSNLSRRLVARIVLINEDNEGKSPPGHKFWSEDFPRMSAAALMPDQEHDQLLKEFTHYALEIDAMMQDISQN